MTGPTGVIQFPRINILSITPDSPVENSGEIKVVCDLVNNTGQPLTGELRLNGSLRGLAANLPADSAAHRFSLRGVAPAMGTSVVVDYYPANSAQPSNTASEQIKTRARFDLVIEKIRAVVRRHALFDDVIQATALAKFGDDYLLNPEDPNSAHPEDRQVYLGDVPPGIDFPPDKPVMSFGSFETTAGDPRKLEFSYIFLNLGPSAPAIGKEITDLVSRAAAAILDSEFQTRAWDQVDQRMQGIHGQLYQQCGASVAVSAQQFSSDELLVATASSGIIRRTLEGDTRAT